MNLPIPEVYLAQQESETGVHGRIRINDGTYHACAASNPNAKSGPDHDHLFAPGGAQVNLPQAW